jgi:hypothetical protein
MTAPASTYAQRVNRYDPKRPPQDDLLAKITQRRWDLWNALRAFLEQEGAWVISVPGSSPLRSEILPGSSMPSKLTELGHEPRHAGTTQRATSAGFRQTDILEIRPTPMKPTELRILIAKSDTHRVPLPPTLPNFQFREPDTEQEMREAAERIAEKRTIRDGLDSWREIKRVETFAGWVKIGKALLIGKRFALRVSGANRAWGSTYSRAFSRWLLDHGFERMPGPTRSVAIELAESAEAITAWRDSLPERRRKRLIHPLSVTRRWKASLAHGNGKCPQDLKREAVAAWRRFLAYTKALPPEQAAPIWQMALAEVACRT